MVWNKSSLKKDLQLATTEKKDWIQVSNKIKDVCSKRENKLFSVHDG